MCKIACTSPCFCNTDPGAPTIKQRPKTALMASIVFSRRYFAHLFQFWFSSKCRKSAGVTEAQFRELRNCFKDIKLNLTEPRPTVNTAITVPQLQLNSEEMLTKKMYFWQQKHKFMPNEIQTKLFINTTLITIEQAFCKPMHCNDSPDNLTCPNCGTGPVPSSGLLGLSSGQSDILKYHLGLSSLAPLHTSESR